MDQVSESGLSVSAFHMTISGNAATHATPTTLIFPHIQAGNAALIIPTAIVEVPSKPKWFV